MSPYSLQTGDSVADSPVGPGVVTGFTEAGFPRVNHISVVWLKRTDGAVYDPFHKLRRNVAEAAKEQP